MGYTVNAGSTGSIAAGGQYDGNNNSTANYGNDVLAYLASAAQAAADAAAVLASIMPVGGGSDHVFYENAQTVTTNYTLTAGKNAMSAGPLTINNGITVTIPSGATWSVL
jgi:hypothetical protein